MDIHAWLKQTRDIVGSALTTTSQTLYGSFDYVQSSLGKTWIFGSNESSSQYNQLVDEKHYFLVPYRKADVGYSLYSMRCVPDGLPLINDLPKRRVFHLPTEHATATVEHLLLAEARVTAEREQVSKGAVGDRLQDLADQIDRLDDRVFNGVLLIGGLVALINPLAGAAVAVKALIPSIGMLLSKYGLKYVGDTANAAELSLKIKSAEKDVLRQFRGSKTTSIVNPLLGQLDLALETSEFEFDPLLEIRSRQFRVRKGRPRAHDGTDVSGHYQFVLCDSIGEAIVARGKARTGRHSLASADRKPCLRRCGLAVYFASTSSRVRFNVFKTIRPSRSTNSSNTSLSAFIRLRNESLSRSAWPSTL